ncbi:unnamed protein product [Lymnaea stagnalis]|uniref:Uncharacterized protein n=1 Tax=Lymnaea stagnalis TaxID=6523 RepID=A0AAV2HJ17_LYMST
MAGSIMIKEQNENELINEIKNNLRQHTETTFSRYSSEIDRWTCSFYMYYNERFNFKLKMLGLELELINSISNEEEESKAKNKQAKIRDSHTVENSSISQHLKDSLKLITELRVWLPSNDNLFLELTMCCNYLIISIMLKVLSVSNSAFTWLPDDLISTTLDRVLKLASQGEKKTLCDTNSSIETKFIKLSETLKDPLNKFKLLSILGRLLILSSLWCLYRKQQNNEHKIKEALCILVSLKELLPQSTMHEWLLLQHDLILCKIPDGNSVEDCPSVDDITKLVLASCKLSKDDTTLKYDKWEWLHTVCICQNLIEEKKYSLAMQRILATLNTMLDPGPRSTLLCLMAECHSLEAHHQLALLTYKEALNVNRENCYIFYLMASVYRTLGLEEYELESLNLLVKVLMDQHLGPRFPVNGFDQMVACVFDILPEVSLLNAMHHFAKRCYQLQKYKESEEQYFALLRFLEHTDLNSNVSNSVNGHLDVCDIVVETAEALVMSHKHSECISFCDKFYPCFITDSSHCQMAHSLAQEALGNNSDSVFKQADDYSNSSQPSLFSSSQNSDVPNSSFDKISENMDKAPPEILKDYALTPGFVDKLCKISRKRVRSVSVNTGPGEIDDPLGSDLFASQTAAIRLLLAKTDALVVTEGYTDVTMACLLKAYNLLSSSNKCDIKSDTEPVDHATEEPLQKRRRLGEEADILNKSKTTFSDETQDVFCLCKNSTWSQLMVSLCVRMAKVSLKRKQYLSVINCCQLILQLEPDNIHANYLRTLVLRDQSSSQKEQVSRKWLEGRGLNLNTSKKELQDLIDLKQREIKKLQSGRATSSYGWYLSHKDLLLSLDVTCLKDVKDLVVK